MDYLASYPQHDGIIDSLKRRNVVSRLGNVVLVTTDVLLPNGSQVTVVIEGGASGERITVSDAGAALISVAEAGLALDASANAAMRRLAARLGLALEAGNLRSEPVQPGDAAYAVTLVANGAREIAKAAFDVGRRKDRRRFRERVEQALCNIFATSIIQKSARLNGYSEDSLRFDYLVTMSNRGNSPGHLLK